jgi:pimeloyl-ACP methyl ester carboxylesterase
MRACTRAGIATLLSLVVAGFVPAAQAASAPRREWPHDCDGLGKAVRALTARAAPRATAAQAASYGLWLPRQLDPGRPLVILVHGLDCAQVHWGGMAQSLLGEGYQVGYFTYPSDQPIAESAAGFGEKMRALRRTYPNLAANLIGYSMGGLVCRAYVEGPDYAGGVARLILVGTPNAGSSWSRVRGVLELQEHYRLWRDDPDWSPTWMITDGLGEAGRDLRPGSRFLRGLNARPRREGVKYTIVCGDLHPARRVGADWLDRTAGSVPRRVRGWWGFRQARDKLAREANEVRNESSSGDGVVNVRRARLEGVDDVVTVHADHAHLYLAAGGEPPAAWVTIRDRLGR